MKSKLVEAGKPIEVEISASLGGAGGKKLSLTIVEEISAGKDRRVYQVKDQHGVLYAYKYMKKRTLQKEISRIAAAVKSGAPCAALVTSGRDPEERGVGFVLREWVEGARGDGWLRSWENFGSPLNTDGAVSLFLLLDTLSRKGMYLGGLDPEDMVYCFALHESVPPQAGHWVIVDCGGTREMAPRAAADRYFWKFIERWGMKLDRHSQAFTNLFTLLAPLGKDLPAFPPLAGQAGGTSPADVVSAIARLEDEDDEDDDEDDDEEDEDGNEIPPRTQWNGTAWVPGTAEQTSPVSFPLTAMDIRSAYPGTPPVEGGYRGGSYEILKDGTERINGRIVPSGTIDTVSAYPVVMATDEESKESTSAEESATPTVEVLNPLVDESTGKKSESE